MPDKVGDRDWAERVRVRTKWMNVRFAVQVLEQDSAFPVTVT